MAKYISFANWFELRREHAKTNCSLTLVFDLLLWHGSFGLCFGPAFCSFLKMGLAYSHLIGVATASHLDLFCELPVNALQFRIDTVLFDLQFAQLGVELADVTLDEGIFSKWKNNNNYASRFAIIWLINWNSMKVTTRHKKRVVPLVEWPMDPQNDCETGICAKYLQNSQWMYM